MNIDSTEVRAVAKKIGASADSVREIASGDLKRMKNDVPECLEGLTANALTDSIGELSDEIAKIATGLDGISQELMNYARRLDIADRMAAGAISGGSSGDGKGGGFSSGGGSGGGGGGRGHF